MLTYYLKDHFREMIYDNSKSEQLISVFFPLNFTDKQKYASTYLVVLSGPNCLAGAAEIQGFHLEAAEGADEPLQIRTCFFDSKRRADDESEKRKKTKQNKC